MKKIIYLLAVLLIFGCTAKRKQSKIIPNYEKEYNYSSDILTDQTPIKILIKEQTNEIEKNIAGLFGKEKQELNLKMRLFINENGKLDYVKFLKWSNSLKKSKVTQSDIVNFLDKQIFVKVKSNGNNIKYAFDISLKPEGAIDEDGFAVAAEEMPSIVGGIKSLASKIIYPEKARKEGIQGRVYIRAFIDSTGNVVKADVFKGIGHGCDKSALSAVKKLHFIPAENHGKKVNAQVVVPVLFRLK